MTAPQEPERQELPPNMTHPSPFADRRPLYQIVAKELIAAIQRGEYPVGSELPSEALLCVCRSMRIKPS